MACILSTDECVNELLRLQGEVYDRHGANSAPIDDVEYEQWVMEIVDSLVALYGMGDPFPMEAIDRADEKNAHMAAKAATIAFGYDEEPDYCEDDEADEE